MPPGCRVRAVSDIHTHNPQARDAIINLEPGMAMRADGLYSAGWHPWWAQPRMDWVEAMAGDGRVVAIGECGIDKRRGIGTVEEQLALTRRHAELAERLGLPLILHIVGAWSEIIGLRKEMRPRQEWIIHGFRGKPELARQLVCAGFGISLGKRYNPGVPAVVPEEKLYRETD